MVINLSLSFIGISQKVFVSRYVASNTFKSSILISATHTLSLIFFSSVNLCFGVSSYDSTNHEIKHHNMLSMLNFLTLIIRYVISSYVKQHNTTTTVTSYVMVMLLMLCIILDRFVWTTDYSRSCSADAGPDQWQLMHAERSFLFSQRKR